MLKAPQTEAGPGGRNDANWSAGAEAAVASLPAAAIEASAADAKVGYMYQTIAKAAAAMAPFIVGIALHTPMTLDLT